MTRAAERLAPIALAVLGTLGLAAASVFRHGRFGSNAFDLGLYDQTVWGYSGFRLAMENTVLETPNLLGNHFQPILIALAPLYWLWDDARMLLIAQAALLALASLPIFLWARRQLGLAAALCFQVAYLVFWGLLAGNIYDFHELAVAAPIVSVALYAVLTGNLKLLWPMVVLGLLTKENLALTFAAIGVYLMLAQRRWKPGLVLFAVTTGWLVIALKLVLPAITGRAYAHWFYPELGSGPGSALVHLVRHPVASVELFFSPREKSVALFNLFAPWLFLPLLSPLVIVMLPTLAERFFSNRPEYWSQGFHYSLVLAPILAFAAVDTVARIRPLLSGRAAALAAPAAGAAVLLAGLYFSFGRLKPLDELGRYTSAEHAAEIRSCLELVPGDASVEATSALVPHLSHRERIFLLDGGPRQGADYLAIDVYTFTFPLTTRGVGALVEDAFARGYGVRCSRAGMALLERGVPGRRLSPELARLLAIAPSTMAAQTP
ncbi:MAG: DUF2079 domain-containing protein [Gaiellaceae bacterium]